MSAQPVHRWDELSLDRVTEMVSRKVISGDRFTLTQVYLKRGTHVPVHRHDDEQMMYVLEGVLRCEVGGREVTVSEGEVLHVSSGVRHQAEAGDDSFVIVVSGSACPNLDRDHPGTHRTSSGAVPSST